MSKILDLPIPTYKGTDHAIGCLWERNNSPVDLTNITFKADIKDAVGGDVLFTLTSANGGFTITDAKKGGYQINISMDDLETVPDAKNTNMTFPFTNVVMNVEADDDGTSTSILYAVLQVYEAVTDKLKLMVADVTSIGVDTVDVYLSYDKSIVASITSIDVVPRPATLLHDRLMRAATKSMEIDTTGSNLLEGEFIDVSIKPIDVVANAVSLIHNRLMIASTKSIGINTLNTKLLEGNTLEANVSDMNITLNSVTMLHNRVLNAAVKSVSIDTTTSGLLEDNILSAEVQPVVVSPNTAELLHGRSLDTVVKSVDITTNNVTLNLDVVLGADVKSISVSSNIANLLYDRVMNASVKSISVDTIGSELLEDNVLEAVVKSVTVSLNTTGLFRGKSIVTSVKAMNISTQDVALVADRLTTADVKSISISLNSADLLYDSIMEATTKTMSVGLSDANLLYDSIMEATTKTMSVGFSDANLLRGSIMNTVTKSIILDLNNVDLLYSEILTVDVKSATISVSDTKLTHGKFMSATVKSASVTTNSVTLTHTETGGASMADVNSSAVMDVDVTQDDTLINLVSTPADGSTQTEHDMELIGSAAVVGSGSSAYVDAPAIADKVQMKSIPNLISKFLMDPAYGGLDCTVVLVLKSNSVRADVVFGQHRYSSGDSGIYYRPQLGEGRLFRYDTGWTNSTVFSGGGKPRADNGSMSIYAITSDVSSETTKFYLNSTPAADTDTTTSLRGRETANEVFCIGVEVGNVEFKAMSVFNKVLTDAELDDIFAEYETRHGTIY